MLKKYDIHVAGIGKFTVEATNYFAETDSYVFYIKNDDGKSKEVFVTPRVRTVIEKIY